MYMPFVVMRFFFFIFLLSSRHSIVVVFGEFRGRKRVLDWAHWAGTKDDVQVAAENREGK